MGSNPYAVVIRCNSNDQASEQHVKMTLRSLPASFLSVLYLYNDVNQYLDYEKQVQLVETKSPAGYGMILDAGMILENWNEPTSELPEISYATERRGDYLFSRIPIFKVDAHYRLFGGLKPKLRPHRDPTGAKYVPSIIFTWGSSIALEYTKEIELERLRHVFPDSFTLSSTSPMPTKQARPVPTRLSKSDDSIIRLVSYYRRRPTYSSNSGLGYEAAHCLYLYPHCIDLFKHRSLFAVSIAKKYRCLGTSSWNEANAALCLEILTMMSLNAENSSALFLVLEEVFDRRTKGRLGEKSIDFLNQRFFFAVLNAAIACGDEVMRTRILGALLYATFNEQLVPALTQVLSPHYTNPDYPPLRARNFALPLHYSSDPTDKVSITAVTFWGGRHWLEMRSCLCSLDLVTKMYYPDIVIPPLGRAFGTPHGKVICEVDKLNFQNKIQRGDFTFVKYLAGPLLISAQSPFTSYDIIKNRFGTLTGIPNNRHPIAGSADGSVLFAISGGSASDSTPCYQICRFLNFEAYQWSKVFALSFLSSNIVGLSRLRGENYNIYYFDKPQNVLFEYYISL